MAQKGIAVLNAKRQPIVCSDLERGAASHRRSLLEAGFRQALGHCEPFWLARRSYSLRPSHGERDSSKNQLRRCDLPLDVLAGPGCDDVGKTEYVRLHRDPDDVVISVGSDLQSGHSFRCDP